MSDQNGTQQMDDEENGFAVLADELKARMEFVAGSTFSNKINSKVGPTVQAELSDYLYGYLHRLAETAAEMGDMVLDHAEEIEELQEQVTKTALLVQGTETGKILVIAARLSELVIAKSNDDEMKELANVILTAARALIPADDEEPAQVAAVEHKSVPIVPEVIQPVQNAGNP